MFPDNEWKVFFPYHNNWVEECDNGECDRESLEPLIAVLEWKVRSKKWKVWKGIVYDGDGYDMEANDNKSANGNVCHNGIPDAIENLAAIEHTKEETNISRIEKDDMQHVLIWEEGIQVPGEKNDAGREAEDTTDGITFQVAVSKQLILSPKIAYIIIR